MTRNFEDPEDIWMCSILFQKVNYVFSSTLKVKGIVVKYGSVSASWNVSFCYIRRTLLQQEL